MEKLKLILGFVLLPMAFVIWAIDRIIFTIMPKLDHENFNKWLDSSTNIMYSAIRILMLFVLRWLFYWIFGL